VFLLYTKVNAPIRSSIVILTPLSIGMASPLMGIAAVNSLLFTAYNISKRIISPFPDLSIGQIALAGSMAGVGNSVLASPGE
jgi:solute carrier family 25 (mitochondrial carnitine/acylcarnitine transporter), member 20/29